MFVTIGRINSIHGLRGEIKVAPESDHPDRLDSLPGLTVFVQKDSIREPYKVTEASAHSFGWRLKLAGVDSREQASRLVGGDLQVPRAKVLPLPEESFYIFDIIGLTVYTVEGELLGQVTDVLQPGANDVYVVQGERELLIPAIKQVVKSIDLDQRRMLVQPLPGLFDQDDDDAH
jgi:16S rRNA processing protein RimM